VVFRPFVLASLGSLVFLFSFSHGAVSPDSLSVRLENIQKKVSKTQKELIEGLKYQRRASAQVKKLRSLLRLQKQERDMSKKRLKRLELVVDQLEARRKLVQSRIEFHEGVIYDSLKKIHQSTLIRPNLIPRPSSEAKQAPFREVLSRMIHRSMREVAAYRADLEDAERLEKQIEEEKQQLTYLLQDLDEKAALLKFHKKLQLDIVRDNYQDRLRKLENYRDLKDTEGNIESLIKQFNARLEYEKVSELEKVASKEMFLGNFHRLKGQLPFPVVGEVVSHFGRGHNQQLGLRVFRKGIEISAKSLDQVSAIFAGKIVFSGKLPGLGNAAIIDHGAKYYSLLANLGHIRKSVGDYVVAGENVGRVDVKGTPVYFEIRSKNVAVNPLQWVTR